MKRKAANCIPSENEIVVLTFTGIFLAFARFSWDYFAVVFSFGGRDILKMHAISRDSFR